MTAHSAMRGTWREQAAGLLILASYVLLAAGMLQRGGFYDPLGLIFVLVSFVMLSTAGVGCARGWLGLRLPSAPWLTAVLLLSLLAGLRHAPGWHIQSTTYVRLFVDGMIFFMLAAFAAYVGTGTVARMWRRPVFGIGVVLALGLRAGIIFASPSPMIDTFTVEQEASAQLLKGGNPYSMHVTDVYEGRMYFGYTLIGYVYPPADLYPRAMSYALLGDVRWVSVIAEAVMALALWLVGRRFLDRKRLELVVLLFLFHPRGLLVIEEAWTEPLILLMFSLFVWSHVYRSKGWAAVAFGYMLALKQYLIFFLVHWTLLRIPPKYLALSLGIALLTVVPFALWDFESLLANGFLFNLRVPFRTDSLTVSSYVYRQTGAASHVSVSIIIGALVSAFCALGFRRLEPLTGFIFAAALSTFAMFLFGHQAFCNYYYFVSGLLLWLMLSSEYRAAARQEV